MVIYLPAGDTKNITINIKFRDDITEADLPKEQQVINLSYQITYTQYDGGNSDLPIGPNGGGVEEPKPESTVMKAFLSNSSISSSSVESVNFLSEFRAQDNAIKTWDASEAGDNSVIGSYVDVDSNGLYEVYIGGTNGVYAPSDCSSMFAYSTIKEINFNGNFDTTNATNMSRMFSGCLSLTDIDLSSFNTSNVTDMSSMFDMGLDAPQFKTLDLSSFDTSNVTTMEFMFSYCLTLESLNIGNFNTSNVINMSCMFLNCQTLKSLNISNFNTSKVTDMSMMFQNCISLTNLDLNNFDTSKVTDMYAMFEACSSLTSLDLSNFNTSKVTNMYSMHSIFGNCNNLTIIKMNSAVFNSGLDGNSMFTNVPDGFTIYVKDEAAKNFILNIRSDANVIIEPLNS